MLILSASHYIPKKVTCPPLCNPNPVQARPLLIGLPNSIFLPVVLWATTAVFILKVCRMWSTKQCPQQRPKPNSLDPVRLWCYKAKSTEAPGGIKVANQLAKIGRLAWIPQVGHYNHQPNLLCTVPSFPASQTLGPGLVCPKTRLPLASGTLPCCPFAFSPPISPSPSSSSSSLLQGSTSIITECFVYTTTRSSTWELVSNAPSQAPARSPGSETLQLGLQVIPKLTHVQESLRCIHFLTAQPQVLPSQLSGAVYRASSLALMPPGNSTGAEASLILLSGT